MQLNLASNFRGILGKCPLESQGFLKSKKVRKKISTGYDFFKITLFQEKPFFKNMPK